MKKYPILCFSVLSCLIGWSLFIAAALGVHINPGGMPLGPIMSAAIVAVASGKEKRKEWWNSLTTIRTSLTWYVAALLVPILFLLIAVGLNHLAGAPLPDPSQLLPDINFFIRFVIMFVLVGIGEEAGWTAFMAPELLKTRNSLVAGAILSIVRVGWHIPLIMAVGGPSWLEAVSGITAFQFLVIWIYRRSGQVWILAAIWHAMNNAVSQHFGPMVIGIDHDRLGLLKAGLYVTLAFVIYLIDWKYVKAQNNYTIFSPAIGRKPA